MTTQDEKTAHGPLTLTQAGHLADLIRAVERKGQLRWYPNGSYSGDPLKVTLRAFVKGEGLGQSTFGFTEDVRDANVWCSGMFEHWFKVADLLAALQNAVDGRAGDGQPMAIIEEAHT